MFSHPWKTFSCMKLRDRCCADKAACNTIIKNTFTEKLCLWWFFKLCMYVFKGKLLCSVLASYVLYGLYYSSFCWIHNLEEFILCLKQPFFRSSPLKIMFDFLHLTSGRSEQQIDGASWLTDSVVCLGYPFFMMSYRAKNQSVIKCLEQSDRFVYLIWAFTIHWFFFSCIQKLWQLYKRVWPSTKGKSSKNTSLCIECLEKTGNTLSALTMCLNYGTYAQRHTSAHKIHLKPENPAYSPFNYFKQIHFFD